MNLSAIVQSLYPTAVFFKDYTVQTSLTEQSGEFTNLKTGVIPEDVTTETLAVQWPTVEAELSKRATLRAGLLAAWVSAFKPGEQAFLHPIYTQALAKFDSGEIAAAKEIIATAPTISEDLTAKQNAIVALFP